MTRPGEASHRTDEGEDIEIMAAYEQHETLQLVADHLEVALDDLEFIDRTATSCTFRQLSTGKIHTARIGVGPEGPIVSLSD